VSSHLNSKSFAECLHTGFEVHLSPDQRVTCELIEVKERHDAPHLEQFSLLFRGPVTPVLSQRIHTLQHERLGQVELFLVPLGPDGQGMTYEVIFNRIRRETAGAQS
jgi:hypothetical protein